MAYDPTDPTGRRRRAGVPAIADAAGYNPAAPASTAATAAVTTPPVATSAVPTPATANVDAPNAVNGAAFHVPPQAGSQVLPGAPPPAQPAPDLSQQRSAPAIAQGASDQINSVALNAIGRNNNTTGPGSADAETMRRLEIAAGGNIGSPSARAAIMGALSGQLGANRSLTAEATQQQGAVLAQGAVAEQNANAAQVNDASQQRLLELRGAQDANVEGMRQTGETTRTGMTEAGATSRNDASIAGNLDVAKLGKTVGQSYQRDVSGTLNLLDGGIASPVTTENGTPYKPLDDTGKLTPADLFKGYNDRVGDIQKSLTMGPEAKQAALAQLNADPVYAPLLNAKAAAPAAGVTADKVPPGAPTAKNAKGERMFQNPATGQWEPIL